MASHVVSGTIRISAAFSVTALAFSTLLTTSAYLVEGFTLSDGVSDFVVSNDKFSAPQFIFVKSDQVCRLAYRGIAGVPSHASAGHQFTHWAQIGSGLLSGPTGFMFANSAGAVASLVLVLGQ